MSGFRISSSSRLKVCGAIAPHVHVFSLNNADFSRDPAAVERNETTIRSFTRNRSLQRTAAEMLKGWPTG
jgi:hypothetical protein